MKTNKKKSIFCLVLILNVAFASFYLHAQDEDSLILNNSEEDDNASSELNFPPISSFVNSDKDLQESLQTEVDSDDKLNENMDESMDANISSDKDEVPDDSGLDNISLSEEKIGVQGNWVKKKEWLKESYKINEQIQNIVKEIDSTPKLYKEKFDAIDSELDAFYKKEGFSQANVSSLFNALNKYLLKQKREISKRVKGGFTSDEEIKLNFLLKENKNLNKQVAQLRLDIKSIYDLDRSIKDRLKKLDDLIKIAMEESLKASGLVDDIWDIIDDKKARTIFYELKGDSLEKVKAIKKYVTQTLKQDFDGLLNLIRTQIETVSSSVEELEANGIIFRDRVERLKQISLKELEDNKSKVEVSVPERNVSFGEKLYNYIVNFFARIHNFLSDL